MKSQDSLGHGARSYSMARNVIRRTRSLPTVRGILGHTRWLRQRREPQLRRWQLLEHRQPLPLLAHRSVRERSPLAQELVVAHVLPSTWFGEAREGAFSARAVTPISPERRKRPSPALPSVAAVRSALEVPPASRAGDSDTRAAEKRERLVRSQPTPAQGERQRSVRQVQRAPRGSGLIEQPDDTPPDGTSATTPTVPLRETQSAGLFRREEAASLQPQRSDAIPVTSPELEPHRGPESIPADVAGPGGQGKSLAQEPEPAEPRKPAAREPEMESPPEPRGKVSPTSRQPARREVLDRADREVQAVQDSEFRAAPEARPEEVPFVADSPDHESPPPARPEKVPEARDVASKEAVGFSRIQTSGIQRVEEPVSRIPDLESEPRSGFDSKPPVEVDSGSGELPQFPQSLRKPPSPGAPQEEAPTLPSEALPPQPAGSGLGAVEGHEPTERLGEVTDESQDGEPIISDIGQVRRDELETYPPPESVEPLGSQPAEPSGGFDAGSAAHEGEEWPWPGAGEVAAGDIPRGDKEFPRNVSQRAGPAPQLEVPADVPLSQDAPARVWGGSPIRPTSAQEQETARGEGEVPAEGPRESLPLQSLPLQEALGDTVGVADTSGVAGREDRAYGQVADSPPEGVESLSSQSVEPSGEFGSLWQEGGAALQINLIRRTPSDGGAASSVSEGDDRSAPPQTASEAPGPDLDALADEVYHRIRERLRIERERYGPPRRR